MALPPAVKAELVAVVASAAACVAAQPISPK
jgi:hypothetical protein